MHGWLIKDMHLTPCKVDSPPKLINVTYVDLIKLKLVLYHLFCQVAMDDNNVINANWSNENLYTISWFDFSMNPFFIKDIDILPKQNWQTGSIALNLQICFINIKIALHHHCNLNLDRSFVLALVKLILNFFHFHQHYR